MVKQNRAKSHRKVSSGLEGPQTTGWEGWAGGGGGVSYQLVSVKWGEDTGSAVKRVFQGIRMGNGRERGKPDATRDTSTTNYYLYGGVKVQLVRALMRGNDVLQARIQERLFEQLKMGGEDTSMYFQSLDLRQRRDDKGEAGAESKKR